MHKPIIAVLVFIAASFTGCSSAPTFQTGEDAELSFDDLTRMEGTVMDAVWARTDIDLTGYRKVMFEGVGVEYREVSGPYSGRARTGTARSTSNRTEFRLHPDTRAQFEAEITAAFREEMAASDVFEIVEEAGPDVLLIVGGLLDVVSRVPPENIGRSRIWLDSVGEATLILEIRSSVSNSIYARAVDRRAAGSQGQTFQASSTVTNRAEVRRLGRRWGKMLRDGLDTLLTEGLKE
jgi:Protein of unknown function (DUF3313)